MATVKCQKITISIKKGNELALLDELQKFGQVELIAQEKKIIIDSNLNELKNSLVEETDLLKKASDIASSYIPEKSFLEKLDEHRVTVTEDEVNKLEKNKSKTLKMAHEIIENKDREAKIAEEIQELTSLIAKIEPYKNFDAPIFGNFNHLFFLAFTIDSADKDNLITEARSISSNLEVYPIWENDKSAAMILAGPKEAENSIAKIVTSKAQLFTPQKDLTGSFKGIIVDSEKKIIQLQKEAESLKTEFGTQYQDLILLHEVLSWELAKIERTNVFVERSDSQYALEAWVDPKKIEDLKMLVKSIDSTSEVRPAGESSDPVMELRNHGLAKAYELVTTMMGYPEPTQVDPTPLLQFFFALFFGLALSDAGYGLVLLMLSSFLLLTRNLSTSLKSVMKILFWCAISTIVFGALEGSWFGFVPWDYTMPANANAFQVGINPFVNWLKYIMVINPVSSVSIMLGLMIALGVGHLFLGYFLGFLQKARQGQAIAGFLDDLVPGLVLLSFTLFGFSGALSPLTPFSEVFKYLAIGFLVLMVLAQGRGSGLIWMIPAGAIKTFLAAVGYISETLSYTRLFALGITTGILAGTVNLMAFLAGGAPVVGPVLIAVIMLLGHAMNIVLNVMSAFIGSTRLHFVEFFPKFMSGGGRPLAPFKRSEDNLILS